MTKYGDIVTGLTVKHAVRETIHTWFPSYIAEIGAQAGKQRADLKPFRSYTSATEMDTWPEDQLPACVIIVPGLLEAPTRQSGGFEAEWSVGLAAVVSARDQDATSDLVTLYVAALRSLVLQHQSMGMGASWRWIDESYDGMRFDDSRTIGAGVVHLGVLVSQVVDSRLGLQIPPEDPLEDPGDWGQVESTGVIVKGKQA